MVETLTKSLDDDMAELVAGAGTGASDEVRSAAVERAGAEWDQGVKDLGLDALQQTVELEQSALDYITPPEAHETPIDLLAPRQ